MKDPLYLTIMNVLTEINPNSIVEVYKNMGVLQISEDNREFLLKAMKKLKLDEKLKEEGKGEERKQLVLKQYSKGLSIEYIAEINDFEVEYVKDVVKDSIQ